MVYDCLIIGAGAAGLFAAANSKGKTLVLEKMAQPGKKLLIAGHGRCNFTHAGNISEFFCHYGDHEKFIKYALKSYTNVDVIKFFKERGLVITEDKNGKLFPQSGNSADILNILVSQVRKNGHSINLNQTVRSITFTGTEFRIETNNAVFEAKKLIIATGGKSYPATGSTGDGYALAKVLGHTIVQPEPSLSPVFIKNYPFRDLAGVSLKDCRVSLFRQGKKIREYSGDIGFTHNGLSGPGIIDFSRFLEAGDELKLNLCGIKTEDFHHKFIARVNENGKATVQSFLKFSEIPKRLVLSILQLLNINPEQRISETGKERRTQLANAFCEFSVLIEKVGGFNVAMATAGGVSLDEVWPKSMESKIQPGLFFAGEVLDIDGDTGGYNLQAAFSTGFLAAQSVNLCIKV
ncbi:MAG: NAD(P)/FAD-dependent oxidoreductase [Bacteroidales bacterium]